MRRLLVLCWTAMAVAACGSDDLVQPGGDCSGGKQCVMDYVCHPQTQRCVPASSLIDARPVDARFDASTGGPADAGADAPSMDGGTGLDTTITSGPMGTINVNTATYNFTCSAPPCTFECSLDTAAFGACTSPTTLNSLAAGAHTFRVRAVKGSETDSTPATASFNVVLAGIATVITENPPAATNQTSATFRFECRVDGAVQNDCTFACTLNGNNVAGCASPHTFSALAVRQHSFTVTASRGGVVGTPDTHDWTIDITPPTVAITSGPDDAAVVGPNPAFTYQPSETAASFACTLDTASVQCGPDTHAFAGLSAGPHTFTVTVTDLAGNTSAPDTANFVVDNAGPTVTVTTPGATSGPSGELAFTAEDPSTPVVSLCTVGTQSGDCSDGTFLYSGLSAGMGSYTIVSTDAVGNVTTTTGNFNVVVNGPVVAILAPVDGAPVCSTGVNLNFDTVPAEAQVTYTCTNNGTAFPCNEGGMNLQGVLIGGMNTITVNATDSLSLTGSATVTVFVDNSRPVVSIATPSPNQVVCPVGTITYTTSDTGVLGPVEIVECTIRPAAGAAIPCTAENGVISYSGLVNGLHTVQLRGRDTCGNMTEPAATRQFDVDAVGPTIENLVATPGALNTGSAQLAFTRNNMGDPAAPGTANAGLAFVPTLGPTPTAGQYVETCTCASATACSCSQLAAGINRLAVRGTDQCGNIGPFATVDVEASFGPFAGHKVAIGHSYEEVETDPQPEDIVGNSAALPYAVRDAGESRPPRVLAFVQNVSDEAVARVQRGIGERVGVHGALWDPSNPRHYHEFTDPDDLADELKGRDVLLVFNDDEPAIDFFDIGDQWNDDDVLQDFLDAGGVAVALDNGVATLYPFRPGAKPGGPGFGLAVKRYGEELFGDDFFIAQGVSDEPYPIDIGEGECVSAFESGVSTVFEGVIPNDGFITCPVVTDEVFPEYDIELGLALTPSLTCFGAVIGAAGTFTVDVPIGPAPTGTFTCQTGPSPRDFPYPMFPCQVEGNTYSFPSGTFEDGWRVDIHLVEPDGVDVARGGYLSSVTVDNAVTFNDFATLSNAPCLDSYTVHEATPFNCIEANGNERVWRSVTCTLTLAGTQIAQRTGSGCGATPAENPDDGFITRGNISNDWNAEVVANGAGEYTVAYVVEDWRGNQATGSRTFTVDAQTLCSPLQ
jgi:hypothetical protein